MWDIRIESGESATGRNCVFMKWKVSTVPLSFPLPTNITGFLTSLNRLKKLKSLAFKLMDKSKTLKLLLVFLLAPNGFTVSTLRAQTPELDYPVVLTQVPKTGSEPSMNYLNYSNFASGGRILVVEPGGKTWNPSAEFHTAADPAVSFDGHRILFAGKKSSSDDWNIYEAELDNKEIRQITRDYGNCRRPVYLSTLYTLDSKEPWYQFAFVSDEAGEIDPVSGMKTFHIYSCNLDGSEVRRLTYNPLMERDPWLMTDGRILYSAMRRSHLHHGDLGRMDLFTIASDGADIAAFTLSEGRRFKRMACQTANGLVVFIESDDETNDGSGQIGSVHLRRNFQSYRSILPDPDYLYHSPSPVPSGGVLISRKANNGSGDFGSFLLNPKDGTIKGIYDDPDYHEIQAKALTATAVPDGRSSVVASSDPNGQLYALDVTITSPISEDWTMEHTIKRLRVLEVIPQRAHDLEPANDLMPPFHLKRILGEIPVEQDGSFFIEIPANIPVELQLIDENGMAVKQCSWIWVRNHEPRGCIGCHEDPELTPPNRMVDAVQKPPRQLTLSPKRRRYVDFTRDVAPIISKNCGNSKCHSSGAELEFTSEYSIDSPAHARHLYEQLLSTDKDNGIRLTSKYIHPGRARTSPLIWQVLGRNTSRPWDDEFGMDMKLKGNLRLHSSFLSEDEKLSLIEWIDLGANFREINISPVASHEDSSSGVVIK
jgi:hypothetical protein